ncbi:MAG: AI-2E family transporter [Fibrobacteres bacterium]|nr:AI-2E family transporter [Fibrobacterota bacterium]
MVRPARTLAHPRGDKVLLSVWILLVVAVGLFAATSAWLLLTPLIVGYLLSVLFAPVCEAMDRRGIPRTMGVAGILVGLVGLLGIALAWATPLVFAQIQEFRDHSEAYLQQASLRLSGLLELLERLVPAKELDKARAFAVLRLKQQGSPFDSLQDLLDVLPLLETILLSLVVAFFLLARGAEVRKSFLAMIPNRYFEMTLRLLHRVQLQTAAYLRGQAMDSIANGILITGTLSILQVPYALFLGAFAGVANAIPLLGPIAGGIPAIALALVGATSTPWWLIAIALLAIHMLDNFLIYPATVGGSLHLPPWVVILGVALGSHLGGILGMLLAVPLIGLARGFILELHDNLKGFRIL